MEKLVRYTSSVCTRRFDSDGALFELHFISDFENGQAALVMRLHHVIADGVALLSMMTELLDPLPHGGMPTDNIRMPGPATMGLLYANALIFGPLLLLQKMLWAPDRNTLHGTKALVGKKSLALSERLSLRDILHVKKQLRATGLSCTINDIMMACVTGALRSLSISRNEKPQELRAYVPVSLRPPSKTAPLTNEFVPVLLPLPVDEPDPRKRIRKLKRSMDWIKVSGEPFFMFSAVKATMELLPESISAPFLDWFADKCSLVLTNVPGPLVPVSIEGRNVTDLMFWVPQRASVALGVSILSYSDHITVGVELDEAFGDAQDLARLIKPELSRLVGSPKAAL
eukprot:TRINITY_DN4446_c0_g1_i3.p1 TRINITY_DN4446_c0_g1~~TRINITY_DN4446_c0_g1_i3.p1  ORF type:complete len:342 (+),score=37.61 TRINITY_DN4446_c0_g1_i3:441-1466(+)